MIPLQFKGRTHGVLLAVAVCALTLGGRAHAEGRLLVNTGKNGFTYYETSVSKFQRNGEVFFGVMGYAVQYGLKDKVEFKALFNCGNRSRIARKQFYDWNSWNIADRLKFMQRPEAIWFSLQAEHCPNRHYETDPTELWK